jgi:hypothetical protein
VGGLSGGLGVDEEVDPHTTKTALCGPPAHLYVLEKVQCGLESARTSGMLSQDAAEQRLGKWLTE